MNNFTCWVTHLGWAPYCSGDGDWLWMKIIVLFRSSSDFFSCLSTQRKKVILVRFISVLDNFYRISIWKPQVKSQQYNRPEFSLEHRLSGLFRKRQNSMIPWKHECLGEVMTIIERIYLRGYIGLAKDLMTVM